MLPWGHASLGYLLYSAWCHARFDGPPPGLPVLALGLGTQFPDLIDKPLDWTFGLLPSGRSLGHSLLILVLVGVAVVGMVYLYRERKMSESRSELTFANGGVQVDSSIVGAFFFGWGSHLIGDSWPSFVGLDDCATYLLWPVTPICVYDEAHQSILAHLLNIELTTNVILGLILTLFAALVWVRDGTPGLEEIRRLITRVG